MDDRDVEELQRIWDLKEKGAITDAEYLQLKDRILSRSAHSTEKPPDNTALTSRPPTARIPRAETPPPGPSYKSIAGVGCLAVLVLFAVAVGISPSPKAADGNSMNSAETAGGNAVAALSPEERQRQIKAILSELKSVPQRDYKRNHDLYAKLADLDPDLQKYAIKRNEYADKMDAAKGPVTEPTVSPDWYEAHPEQALSIKNFRWTKEGFGSVMSVSFTVKNAASFAIKDFDVKCVHSAPSGTQIDENERTIYEVVPANGSKAVRDFSMGFIASQAARSYCTITGATKA